VSSVVKEAFDCRPWSRWVLIQALLWSNVG
jgi:hypothetical protein